MARLESSGFLAVGTFKAPSVCSSCLKRRGTYRIVDACQTIRNYTGIFERMLRSMTRRVEASIKSHGEHFKQLL
jgi:hypothetical protein